MTSNIDAAIFLPGHIGNGSENIDVPLMAVDQINRLINLYRQDHWAPFFPYIGAALTLMKSDYVCEKTPLVNKWINIVKACDNKYMEHILCILLLKYGWEIPDNIIERCSQYVKHIADSGDNSRSRYRNNETIKLAMDADDLEMSRILHQLDHKSCMNHLTYIGEYCIGVVDSVPKIDLGNMINMLMDEYNIPSNLNLYNNCVRTLVNMCVLSSYIGVTIKIPESILDSDTFRACLLQQPIDLLNYYCGNMSVVDRFALGVGKRIPEYDNKKILLSLMEKITNEKHHSPSLSMIGTSEMHKQPKLTRYSKMILGLNPSASDYAQLYKGFSILPQLWYCGALACNNNLDSINRMMILKSLAGMWRMSVGNYTRMPIGYITEIAKRVNANMDDILGSSFSMKMSNVSWALKDMPELYDMGLPMGPITTNMISIYVIKHAQHAQSITGLQRMVEAINGNK